MNQQEQKKVDVILYSPEIKRYLRLRLSELNLKMADVVKDAANRGMGAITKEKLSRYFRNENPIRGFPTQLDVLWLCTRYGISVTVNVKLAPYNEEEATKRANSLVE